MSNVDVRCHDFLRLYHIHVLKLFDEPIELLDCLLVLVTHHSLDVCDLLAQIRRCCIEMLISNLVEDGIFTCQDKISSTNLWYLELLSYLLLWVHDDVLH